MFNLEPQIPRPYEFEDDVMIAISFEHDPDLKVIERQFSTLLDVLADVGGLESALVTVCTVIVHFINGAKLQNFLIGSLYSQTSNQS